MNEFEPVLSEPPRAGVLPQFIINQAQFHARERHQIDISTAHQHKKELRERLADSLGITRLPRCEASARSLGVIERRDFTIEKLVFEATPGLPVPAHLYAPRAPGPHPAVVHVPGHWMENAKLAPDIQRMNLELVQNGVVTLCYDPLGQGERRVGWHQHGQLAPLLVGFTSMAVMVRDSLAGIDILCSREEVDSSCIGMMGASGGGFSTIFASALDDRISAAAIGCIVNSHVGQLRDAAYGTGWDSWVDLCNQVPRLCLIGTMAEILSATLPRNLLVANADHDPAIPISSALEVAHELAGIAEDQDCGDSFEFAIVPGGHGLHPAMRDVMGSFMVSRLGRQVHHHLRDTTALLAPEWDVVHNRATALRPQSMQRRPSEDACWDEPVDSNRPVVALAQSLAIQCRTTRSACDASTLRGLLGPYPDKPQERPSVSLHVPTANGYVQRVRIPIEEGIYLDAALALPRNWSDQLPPVFVMLDEGGKSQAAASREVEVALALGCAALLPDLRGTGEMAASEFEVASGAWMLERDLFNQRLCDTFGAIDFLSNRYSTGAQIDKGRIVLWGNDAFGFLALVAAALDDRVAAVGVGRLESLEDLLGESSDCTPMAYRYGLLHVVDVPQLVDLMRPRKAFIGVKASDLSEVIPLATQGSR